MTYDEKDSALQARIIEALVQRYEINRAEEEGTAHFGHFEEDLVTPCVDISKDEIRDKTGRSDVRKVVMTQYVEALSRPGFTAHMLPGKDIIRVCIEPERTPDNMFRSLDALVESNNEMIIKQQIESHDEG
ncbi:hypothetical protein FBZ89_109222 [Nitrospirillum amazonense]|uniref:Uncharacterized protein n=1 Tax=Nitrospirillum amazonense TaxID=28077 RepID=A0A560FB50_9PROT|nr:hypothetical protein [Nitrospirillum amazonense]TWB18836.1 hypothetical protein FBZ89_109222 [Nitrospirillum amazonense]